MPRFDVNSYVDVQQRIVRFWEEYPDGRISTELMSLPDEFERVVFRASVYKHFEHAVPAATGWAAEVAGGQGANQTSWHENGETSAIGRALANMGYATTGADRPSKQEMAKASRGSPAARTEAKSQPEKEYERAQPIQLRRLHALARDLGWEDAKWKPTVYKEFGVQHVNELTPQQADAVAARLKAKVNEMKAKKEPLPLHASGGIAGEPGNDRHSQ